MKKQIMIIGLIILLIIIGLSGCFEDETEKIIIEYTSEEDALNKLIYTNSDYNYGFNLPEGWCIATQDTIEQEPGTNFLVNYDGGEDLFIFIYPWSFPVYATLESDVDAIIEQNMKDYSNYNLISTTNMKINEMSAVEIVQTYDDYNGKSIKKKEILMVKENKGLIVSLSTPVEVFSTYVSSFDEFIESFYIFDEDTDVTLPQEGKIRSFNTEYIEGKYNARIESYEKYLTEALVRCWDDDGWETVYDFIYTKDDYEYKFGFIPALRDALNWTKMNTNENCTVLCWWDYGHMMEGYAERNAIAKSPSQSMTWSIAIWNRWSEEDREKYLDEIGGWTSEEINIEIANFLTTVNISLEETNDIIQKYNISYILTCKYDKQIAYIIFNVSDRNVDEYYTDYVPNENANNTLIYKMFDDVVDIYGLNLVYEDENYEESSSFNTCRIFEVNI